jgi:hypothetical protein
MDNIVRQLNELKNIKPNQDWVERQRELLLSQITRQSAAKPQSFLVNSWFLAKSLVPGGFLRFVAQPVGVFAVLVLFAFCSGIFGVSASKGSLPGDFLYPVKLSSEKVKVGLTVKSEKKAVLHVEFAEERVKEIEAVAQKEKQLEKKKEKIQTAVAGLKEEMAEAQKTLDKVKETPKKAQEIVAAAKQVNEKTTAISEKIEQKKSETDNQEIVKFLDSAIKAADAAGVKAVEVIVEKHEAGAVQLTQEEVKKTIESIGDKINKKQEEVKAVVEEVQEVSKTVSGNDVSANDANKSAGEQVAGQDIADKLKVIKAKPIEADQKLSEAKNLLSQGDLSSALKKVKQSAEITEEVKEGVEEINEAMSNK